MMNAGTLATAAWRAAWKEAINAFARTCFFASCTHCNEQVSQADLLKPDHSQKMKIVSRDIEKFLNF